VWTGALMSEAAAREFFGAHEAVPLSQIPFHLDKCVSQASKLYINLGTQTKSLLDTNQWRLAFSVVKGATDKGIPISPLRPIVHGLRWKKSDSEVSLLRTSAKIASKAMIECISASSQQNVSEHEIAALFEWTCKAQGAKQMAYPPVVASGADACTIHYSRNDKMIRNGVMLLLDGGCEYHGYCSDITRTWPTDGKLQGAKRQLYDVVFQAHQALVSSCVPGNTLRHLHKQSIDILTEGLDSLGLLKLRGSFGSTNYRTFYPHSVGHWLGLDTHDSSTVSHDLPLEPGVALTIEPGLYIPDSEEFGPFRGIGIRLEDDIIVTENGTEILSEDVPIDPDDVTDMMANQ